MAIRQVLGGIAVTDHQFTTVIPVSELLRLTIGGMAFEQEAARNDEYNNVADRVAMLAPARAVAQRSFYAPALKSKRVVGDDGERHPAQIETWSETAKLRNAKGDLLKYVKGPFIDEPDQATAGLPAFVLYIPEHLPAERADFDAGMGGEFYLYDFTDVGRAMILDGESRHYAIDRALAEQGPGALDGHRKQRLRDKLVTVQCHFNHNPVVMGQLFSDLNSKGVKITTNDAASRDIRDPWNKVTREIAADLGLELENTGRQLTAVSRHAGKHLLFSQFRTMVRALGLGSFSGAVSAAERSDDINWERVRRAGVEWFGIVLKHFGGPEVFTDPERVLRTVPVKVALGIMGHDWYATSVERQAQHIAALSEINWHVSSKWNGIAGKVVTKDGISTLSSSGAKENGSRAVQALTSANNTYGRRVRSLEGPEDEAPPQMFDDAPEDAA